MTKSRQEWQLQTPKYHKSEKNIEKNRKAREHQEMYNNLPDKLILNLFKKLWGK